MNKKILSIGCDHAAPELKEMATAIIPGNDADGVARFLLHRKEQGLL